MADAGQQTVTIQQALDLAVQHHSEGRLPEAEGLYQQVLQADPNQPVALHLLGVIAHQVGKNDVAIDLITKALAIKPDFADAHNNLGNALRDLGWLNRAVASYHNALTVRPDFAEAHYNLGIAFQDLGKLDQAVASYHNALTTKPDYAEAHYNLGIAHQALGRLDDAVASYHKAVTIKPDYAEAHNNLGIAFQDLGKQEQAVASYHKALTIKPDYAEAHNNLGIAFQDLEKLDQAIASYHKALAIKPDHVAAHNNLGNALTDLGKLDEAVASYRKALTIKPEFAEAHSNLILSMAYFPEITSENILQEARQWEARCSFQGEIPKHFNTPEPDRRLRVGLVSGDLRHHSVSYFLKDILSEIDNEKLEVFAYATSSMEDDLTARLKSIVPRWRKAAGLSDKQLAEDIIADRIDILVDLSGHTAHNRLPVFSRKPAPIQVTWLGYGGTTGVTALDYILCDHQVLPATDEDQFTEKPWRLPEIWLCFSPPAEDIAVGRPPVLASGHITFGSFNNLTKVSDRTVACWARVLKAVPDSRLLLKAKQLKDTTVQEEARARFKAHGIDRRRLTLKSRSPDNAEHFRTYQEIDIALDSFPYAGAATSIEALWMGTPVLTLKGDHFVSHMGESILHNVGLAAWIAETPEDYVEKAKAFAADLPGLSALRANLRGQLLASPVCDAVRFAKNLEDAFRGMWRQWCTKRSV